MSSDWLSDLVQMINDGPLASKIKIYRMGVTICHHILAMDVATFDWGEVHPFVWKDTAPSLNLAQMGMDGTA